MNDGLKGLDEFLVKHTSLLVFCLGVPFSLWLIQSSFCKGKGSAEDHESPKLDTLTKESRHQTKKDLSVIATSNRGCSSSRLLTLDEELIAQLWPPGWISEGMEASKLAIQYSWHKVPSDDRI